MKKDVSITKPSRLAEMLNKYAYCKIVRKKVAHRNISNIFALKVIDVCCRLRLKTSRKEEQDLNEEIRHVLD